MRALLGLAALGATALASAAYAQHFSISSFGSSSAVPRITRMPERGHHRDGRFEGHVHRGVPATALAYGYGGYGGYNDYGDFDGNRGFDPDKWNDWWHDRPDRAYPRWMSHNQDCARRWYSGDVLTC
jgi:hypothetical protein